MNFRVSRVAELLQQQIFFRTAGDNLFRFLNGAAFMPFAPSVGTGVRARVLLSSLRRSMLMVSGIVSVRLATARGGNVGQSNTGVTAGRFHQLNARSSVHRVFRHPNVILAPIRHFTAETRVA